MVNGLSSLLGLYNNFPDYENHSNIMDSLFKIANPTHLAPYDEMQYQKYATSQQQPINDPTYDFRGFYQAKQYGMPVSQEINWNDGKHPVHYSDGYTNPFTNEYHSFKRAINPEKFWEMIPDENQNDQSVINMAKQLGVY